MHGANSSMKNYKRLVTQEVLHPL